MLAEYELRHYSGKDKVWVGIYENLRNLSHWHNDCELIFVLKGNASVFVSGEVFAVSQGQTVFIDSGEIHHIEANEDSILVFIIFDYVYIKDVFANDKLKSPLLTGDYGIVNLAMALDEELNEKKPYYDTVTINLIVDLMIKIYRSEKIYARKNESDAYSERYKALLVEIERCHSWYTFSDAAAFMGLSEHYFSELFHKLAGMTFSKYINYVKIQKAVSALKSGNKTVTEISLDCGFNTIRHFNRVFKEVTGFSPSELPKDYDVDIVLIKDTGGLEPTLEGSRFIEDVRGTISKIIQN